MGNIEVGVHPPSRVSCMGNSEVGVHPPSRVSCMGNIEVGGHPSSRVSCMGNSEVGGHPPSRVSCMGNSEVGVLPALTDRTSDPLVEQLCSVSIHAHSNWRVKETLRAQEYPDITYYFFLHIYYLLLAQKTSNSISL